MNIMILQIKVEIRVLVGLIIIFQIIYTEVDGPMRVILLDYHLS